MEGRVAEPWDWVSHLGGEPIVRTDSLAGSALQFGQFRYLDLPARFEAPPINAHYISITVGGRPRVERILNGLHEEAEFSAGTCLLMPAGHDNAWRWSEPTEEIEFFLNGTFFEELALGYGFENIALDARFAFTDKTLWRLAMIILEESRISDRTDAHWLNGMAQLVGLHLLRRYSKRSALHASGAGLTTRQVRLIKEFTLENIDRSIQVEELSAIVGLSPYHFSRLFKKTIGQSPYRWLIDQRVSRARDLLCHTDRSIADIAADVGFQTQSRFGCVFKERTGATPHKFRKNFRK